MVARALVSKQWASQVGQQVSDIWSKWGFLAGFKRAGKQRLNPPRTINPKTIQTCGDCWGLCSEHQKPINRRGGHREPSNSWRNRRSAAAQAANRGVARAISVSSRRHWATQQAPEVGRFSAQARRGVGGGVGIVAVTKTSSGDGGGKNGRNRRGTGGGGRDGGKHCGDGRVAGECVLRGVCVCQGA